VTVVSRTDRHKGLTPDRVRGGRAARGAGTIASVCVVKRREIVEPRRMREVVALRPEEVDE